MRVLIIGSGGREHALAWAISTSPLLTKLYVAPGNPGTAMLATNLAIGALDFPALVDFARAEKIDLVIPGPEAPLVAGLTDAMQAAGIPCCGPTARAAELEGSKARAHEICDAAGIPTAAWESFTDTAAALDFVARRGAPIVIKADGLAAGKGVVVAATIEQANQAVHDLLAAYETIVIEECLSGEEVSLFALCDGADAILLGAAQDHKRLRDRDEGPNTGGMGAISPAAGFPVQAQQAALETFIRPVLHEMAARGTPFRGILFAGLMLTPAGARLIEYNARLGDPEAQVLLPRLATDLLPALQAACTGMLAQQRIDWLDITAIAVALAAEGYPGRVTPGTIITGLADAATIPHTAIFHAGTELHDGHVIATGGRVLTVCATGPDAPSARATAYRAIAKIHFPGHQHRTDIGLRAGQGTPA